MAGSAEVFAQIKQKPGVTYAALTPNLQGFEAAMLAGVKEVAVFAAASEAFSQKNINCSIAESLQRFVPLMDAAREQGIRVRGYVSCVLGCPYEGEVAPQQVAAVARELFEMGCYEVSLGDTIGTGTAGKTRTLFEAVGRDIPRDKLAGHFHDTYGQALSNTLASLELGVWRALEKKGHVEFTTVEQTRASFVNLPPADSGRVELNEEQSAAVAAISELLDASQTSDTQPQTPNPEPHSCILPTILINPLRTAPSMSKSA